jgi:putative ABC transport system permease protein
VTEIRRFLNRLVRLFRPGKADSELSREIAAHLQLLEDRFVSQGMRPDDARYAAKRAFGGVEQTKELQRDERSFRWLAGWPIDLKLGARMLVKTPGLTVIAVIALAVAIGGGAAYLEFVNDFFRPKLSFAGGNRLVGILNFDLSKADVETKSLHEFGLWKGRLRTIADVGVGRALEQNLITADGRIEPIRGIEISASIFRVIPTAPLYGRPLLDDDERPGATPVVVIGEDLWRARFGADPAIVGRTVRLGETTHTVIGVMPAGFGFPVNSTLWTPWRLDPAAVKRGEGPGLRIFGRLTDRATLEEAQAELDAHLRAAGPRYGGQARPGVDQPYRWLVKPWVESLWVSSNMRWQMRVLYGINIFFIGLLGICAANVATLVFARTATREGEITVRTALGATRGRIVAQLVAEAFVLTSIAAAAGLPLATFVLRRIREIWVAAQNTPMPFWWNERLGIETLMYVALLVAIASLLVGGVPALKATRAEMQARLKEAGASGSTMRFGKLWTGVIVTQVAVTMVFLLAVVSMGWDFLDFNRRVTAVAFPRHEYLVANVDIEDTASQSRQTTVLRELQRRLNEDPGVINAAFTVRLPGGNAEEFRLEFAQPEVASGAKKPGDVLWVGSARVGSNYFETFNQAMLAGRSFTESEVENDRHVAVVDESFVKLVLGGRNPIGLLVRQPPNDVSHQPGPWFEIIGVVKDMSLKPDKTTEDAMLYRPRHLGGSSLARLAIHAKTADAPARLRAAAAATDPEIRLTEVMTMDRLAETEAQTMGFFTTALAAIAAVALLLSTAGIYALISFTLSRRTREIGIRTALGAAPRRIITGVLSRACIQVGIGIVLGAIPGGALIAFESEVSSSRGWWMAVVATSGVAMFIIVVSMISCIPPVRRALRVHPTDALRTT